MRQPLRDLVWLFRGGPPPGPAMVGQAQKRTTRYHDETDVEIFYGEFSLCASMSWWVVRGSPRAKKLGRATPLILDDHFVFLPRAKMHGGRQRRRSYVKRQRYKWKIVMLAWAVSNYVSAVSQAGGAGR